jgi:hypothetical protein
MMMTGLQFLLILIGSILLAYVPPVVIHQVTKGR